MEVIGVDPRDQTWEVDPSKYRVSFHSDGGGVSDEYDLVINTTVASTAILAEHVATTFWPRESRP